ncbi:MAG: hypothetical protein J6B04_03780 [Clostridia bacterium]|nr:hypothetical protein [Clostridia bacterium]
MKKFKKYLIALCTFTLALCLSAFCGCGLFSPVDSGSTTPPTQEEGGNLGGNEEQPQEPEQPEEPEQPQEPEEPEQPQEPEEPEEPEEPPKESPAAELIFDDGVNPIIKAAIIKMVEVDPAVKESDEYSNLKQVINAGNTQLIAEYTAFTAYYMQKEGYIETVKNCAQSFLNEYENSKSIIRLFGLCHTKTDIFNPDLTIETVNSAYSQTGNLMEGVGLIASVELNVVSEYGVATEVYNHVKTSVPSDESVSSLYQEIFTTIRQYENLQSKQTEFINAVNSMCEIYFNNNHTFIN